MYRLTMKGEKKVEELIAKTGDETLLDSIENTLMGMKEEDLKSLSLRPLGGSGRVVFNEGEDFIDMAVHSNKYYKPEFDLDGTAEELFLQVRNGYIEDLEACKAVKSIIDSEITALHTNHYAKYTITATEKMAEQICYLCEAIEEEQNTKLSKDYNIGRMKYEVSEGCLIGCSFNEDGIETEIIKDGDSIVISFTDARNDVLGYGGSAIPISEFMVMDRKEFDRTKNEIFFYSMVYDEPEETHKNNKSIERD